VPCPSRASRVCPCPCPCTCPFLEVFVRPRGKHVGVASVSFPRQRVLKGLCGLSFCGRVETNFETFVCQGCEEFVDAVGAPVGCMRVQETGVHEAFCDSLLSREGLLALEAANVGKSRLDGLRDNMCVRTAASLTSQACALSAEVAVVK
jgi:hypothetical protein